MSEVAPYCCFIIQTFSFVALFTSRRRGKKKKRQSAAQTVAKQQIFFFFVAQQQFRSRVFSGVILRELVMEATESSHQDPHIQLQSSARLISKSTLSPAPCRPPKRFHKAENMDQTEKKYKLYLPPPVSYLQAAIRAGRDSFTGQCAGDGVY